MSSDVLTGPNPAILETDEELAALRKQGFTWAGIELTNRMAKIALEIGNRTNIPGTLAEDRIQEAMIALQRAFDTWSPDGGASVRTYCNRIVSREMVSLYRVTCERGRINPALVSSTEIEVDGEVVDLADAVGRDDEHQVDLMDWWLPGFENFVFDAVYEIKRREPGACCSLLLAVSDSEMRRSIRKAMRNHVDAQGRLFEPGWESALFDQIDLVGRALWWLLSQVAQEGLSPADLAYLLRVPTKLVRKILSIARSA